VKKRDLPKFSVVIPVKNGEKLIKKCLESLKRLNYPQKKIEIIIADGFSTDKTRTIARKFRVKVVDNPKTTVVAGRNVGFLASKGDLIAFTDVDCTFHKDWLINAVKYFTDPKVGGISGPNLVPSFERPFGKAVSLIFDMAYAFNAGSPTKQYKRIIKSRSHGSNAIFRREVLEKIFPIDETLVEGEDVLMTQKVEDLGYQLLYVPDVIVYHFRRTTPKSWLNQMMRYAQAKVLLQRRRVRGVTLTQKGVGFFIPFLVILFVLNILFPRLIFFSFLTSLIFIVGLFVYGLYSSKSFGIAFNFVYACIIMVFAWSFGYLRELLFASNQKWRHE